MSKKQQLQQLLTNFKNSDITVNHARFINMADDYLIEIQMTKLKGIGKLVS